MKREALFADGVNDLSATRREGIKQYYYCSTTDTLRCVILEFSGKQVENLKI